MLRYLGIAVTLLIVGCTTSQPPSGGQQSVGPSPYLSIAIVNLGATVADLVAVYGPLPGEATDALVATRAYGETICAVMTAPELTPDVRYARLTTELVEPRQQFDQAEVALLQAKDMEPAVMIAVKSAIRTTRSTADLAVSEKADPAAFTAPCAALGSVPRVVTAAR